RMEQGRLAGTIRPDYRMNRVGLNRQVHVLHDGELPETLHHSLGAKYGIAHERCSDSATPAPKGDDDVADTGVAETGVVDTGVAAEDPGSWPSGLRPRKAYHAFSSTPHNPCCI